MSGANSSDVDPEVNDQDERIILNIGGKRFETFRSTLLNIADTRLAWIAEKIQQVPEYDNAKNELYFDRHAGIFEEILNFYRTGKLHCPRNVCGPVFEEELSFWGIDDKQMETCCWMEYSRHRNVANRLKSFSGSTKRGREESMTENVSEIQIAGENDESGKRKTKKVSFARTFITRYHAYRPTVWEVLENPHASLFAKIINWISMTFLIASVTSFCLSTVPVTPLKPLTPNIEYLCGTWFTLEFVVRLIFCPSFKTFFKSYLTWVDLLAILSFYLQPLSFSKEFKFFLIIRLIRIFRIFRFSLRLRILVYSLKASLHELGLLLLVILVSVVFFSTIMFYVENQTKGFQNIPQCFWWAIITMATVGYGDVTPDTTNGKVICCTCALWGVLMIALPISIVNGNFSLYYSHAQALIKLPKKSKRALLSPGTRRSLREISEHPNQRRTSCDNAAPFTFGDDAKIDDDIDEISSATKNRFNWQMANNLGGGISTRRAKYQSVPLAKSISPTVARSTSWGPLMKDSGNRLQCKPERSISNSLVSTSDKEQHLEMHDIKTPKFLPQETKC